ncbi:MAG: NAD(P)/FAD-dependent oxidoreductase [Anaerolineae bacterium]|nr:NAD(P)/FAD-dependent oxidoreductase [Anaerolineae bacterium]
MTQVDVVVMGGGPAGCSAAITLARQGASVVLFEAKTYPHHKVCGEFLSPECAHFLTDLGAAEPLRDAGLIEIRRVRVTASDGLRWDTVFPAAGWGVTRSTLDMVLAGRARSLGVDVREGMPVTGIAGDLHRGFTVSARSAASRIDVSARAVIGAYGKRSTVDRALKRRFLDSPQPFIGLKNHFYGPPLRDRLDLHGFPGGYCGLSEVEGGMVNVCLLSHQSAFDQACDGQVGDPESFARWMQTQNPYLGEWLAQAMPVHQRWMSIAQVPFVRKPLVEGDVLMVGDAARLIVPLAGDGMAMAIHSGQLAATHVYTFLRGQLTAEALRQQYRAVWQQTFGLRLRVARALQVFMLRPRLLGIGLRLLHALPPLGSYLVTHTRDARFIG